MEEEMLSRAMTVADARQAAVFTNSRLRRLLMLFAAGPLSVGEAAARSGIELKRLHHHVVRLRRLGLLQVAGERRRAGRPVKLYVTPAPAFFVPDTAAPAPFGERLARELRESLAAERSRSSAEGMLFTLGPGGEPVARTVGEDRTGEGPGEMWQILRLRPADARTLTAELRELLRRYEGTRAEDGPAYLVHAAVVRRTGAGLA
jgi:hypothetical protein